MAKSHTVDLTSGSVTKKLLSFAVPILLSSLLQHFYTIADRVVVGNFADNGTVALAAVGATNPTTNLLLNLFNGISVGANVVCSNLRGSRQMEKLDRCMHTSVVLAAIFGTILSVIGISLAGQILSVVDTPTQILPSATVYMRIYFVGMPASMIYNFGAAIMRAHGDSRRSMYILGVTGLVNVVLNLLLVIGFGLDVEGVAIATVVAQYLSAVAVLYLLFSKKQEYKLQVKKLRVHKDMLRRVVAIGVPCGINGILQSASNVILQSSVNSFNSAYIIAGNTAATDINQFAYIVNSAFSTACVSFAGQCCGAKKYKRLDKLVVSASVSNCLIVFAVATVVTLIPRQLLGIFNPDPLVVDQGMFKMLLLCWTAGFFAVSEIMVACMRGMGRSITPTVINIVFLCGVRAVWGLFLFPHFRNIKFLYSCFPTSWIIALVVQIFAFLYYRKKLYRQ